MKKNKLKSSPSIINFSNNSTGVSSVLWIFGDSTTSSKNNGIHTYNKPGTYHVLLIVSASKICTDTLKWIINVKGPTGGFSPFTPNVCKNESIRSIECLPNELFYEIYVT